MAGRASQRHSDAPSARVADPLPILGGRLLDAVLADATVCAVAAQGRDAGFQLTAVQRDALASRAASRPRAFGALGKRHARESRLLPPGFPFSCLCSALHGVPSGRLSSCHAHKNELVPFRIPDFRSTPVAFVTHYEL